jgi:hypothetical protein
MQTSDENGFEAGWPDDQATASVLYRRAEAARYRAPGFEGKIKSRLLADPDLDASARAAWRGVEAEICRRAEARIPTARRDRDRGPKVFEVVHEIVVGKECFLLKLDETGSPEAAAAFTRRRLALMGDPRDFYVEAGFLSEKKRIRPLADMILRFSSRLPSTTIRGKRIEAMDLTDIFLRLIDAKAPDAEIDCALAVALSDVPKDYVRAVQHGVEKPFFWHATDHRALYWAPSYSASLEEALGLVRRVLPGWTWTMKSSGFFILNDPAATEEELQIGEGSTGATLAISVLLELIRAKA